MIQDAQNFVRVQNIYNPENFDKTIKKAAKFIKEHVDNHGSLPTREQIKAVTGTAINPIDEVKP
jgi:hypothetical protein